MILRVMTLSCLIRVSMEIVKLKVTLKNEKSNPTRKENGDVECTSRRNEITETIEKLKLLV